MLEALLTHDLISLKSRNYRAFPFAFFTARDFYAVIAATYIADIGQGLALRI